MMADETLPRAGERYPAAESQRPHVVTLNERRELTVTGVRNVDSFDSEAFLMETEQGYLAIKGSGLSVKELSLDQGKVVIEGLVQEMGYLERQQSEPSRGKGVRAKLFR